MSIAKRVHDEVGIDFEFIDIGGGFGVPYKPEDKEFDLAEFAPQSCGAIQRLKLLSMVLASRFCALNQADILVCDASILLTTVNTVKVTPSKKFVGVDAGFNTLVRPTMYGSYHPILVANKLGAS